MYKLRIGDRVWVRIPTLLSERKVGTVMAVGKTGEALKYTVEWETELPEKVEKSRYSARQIAMASDRR